MHGLCKSTMWAYMVFVTSCIFQAANDHTLIANLYKVYNVTSIDFADQGSVSFLILAPFSGTKRSFTWTCIEGKRSRGRQRKIWMDNVSEDLNEKKHRLDQDW